MKKCIPCFATQVSRILLDSTGTASADKIDYFDGLGRSSQTVLRKFSPGLKDIVTLREYDTAGRLSRSYLPVPVTTATGEYVSPATVKPASDSFYGDAHAYEKPVYEPSPLNRVMEQYGPGSAWHAGGKPVKTGWMVNGSSGELSCALYAVASGGALERTGLFSARTGTRGQKMNGHFSFTTCSAG